MITWQQLQDKALIRRKDDKTLGMAHSKCSGSDILGKAINKWLPTNGVCLDIGCGLLPKPYYMKVADTVEWHGIDPWDEGVRRNFVFRQGIAERLPYLDDYFDGVCFATSLDHVKDVDESIKEASRVLKKDGCIFVWSKVWTEKQIREWLERGGMWNENHLRGFSLSTMLEYFVGFESIYRNDLGMYQMIFVFKNDKSIKK